MNLLECSGFFVTSWTGENKRGAGVEGGMPVYLFESTECRWVWSESTLEKEARFGIGGGDGDGVGV